MFDRKSLSENSPYRRILEEIDKILPTPYHNGLIYNFDVPKTPAERLLLSIMLMPENAPDCSDSCHTEMHERINSLVALAILATTMWHRRTHPDANPSMCALQSIHLCVQQLYMRGGLDTIMTLAGPIIQRYRDEAKEEETRLDEAEDKLLPDDAFLLRLNEILG